MNRLTLILALLCFSTTFHAQDRVWKTNNISTVNILNKQIIDFDSLDNVYLLYGESGLSKILESNGEEVFNIQLSADSTLDVADIKVLANGNIYAVGSQENSRGEKELVVAAFNTNGNLIWYDTYGSNTNYDDYATAMDVDSVGNLYVTGVINDDPSRNNNCNIITRKYDNAGNLSWSSTFDGLLSKTDLSKDIAVNSYGEVYVVGSTEDYNTRSGGVIYRGKRSLILKYNSTGNLDWRKKSRKHIVSTMQMSPYSTLYYNNDEAYLVAIEGSNVYVAEDLFADYTPNDWDWYFYISTAVYPRIRKINSFGNVVFSKNLNTHHNHRKNNVKDIKFDDSSNIYLKWNKGVPNTPNYDYQLEKWDTSGVPVFSKSYGGIHGWYNFEFEIANNHFFTAYNRIVYTPNVEAFQIQKFDLNGNLIWTKGELNSSLYLTSLSVKDQNPFVSYTDIQQKVAKYCGDNVEVDIIINDTIICPGDSIQLLTQKSAGVINWNFSSVISDTLLQSPWAFPKVKETFTVTTTDWKGCFATDSVRVDVPSKTIVHTICKNDSVLINGEYYTQSFTDTLINPGSCDSVVYHVIKKEYKSLEDTVSICEGDSVLVANRYVKTPGIYFDTLSSNLGCDSLLKHIVVFKSVSRDTNSIVSCNSYFWRGQNYLLSGLYHDTLLNSSGCDSILSLDLTINQEVRDTNIVSACNRYYWSNSGVIYTISGFYSDTLQSSQNCDSIITLDLSIHQPKTLNIQQSSCESFFWPQNSLTYNQSGVYSDTVQSINGCDSIINLNLTIYPSQTNITQATSCGPYQWLHNNQVYVSSGLYHDTLQTTFGCDSILQLDLNIDTVNNVIYQQGDSLIVDEVNATYSWFDCIADTTVPNSNNRVFKPLHSGTYGVEVVTSNCTDSSSCFTMILSDLNLSQNREDKSIKIYPNPSNGILFINGIAKSGVDLKVFSLEGKLIESIRLNDYKSKIDLVNYPNGIYFLNIERETYKIIKNN